MDEVDRPLKVAHHGVGRQAADDPSGAGRRVAATAGYARGAVVRTADGHVGLMAIMNPAYENGALADASEL